MPTAIRELVLDGLKASLAGATADVPGLTFTRNDDSDVDDFPALNQVDADSSENVIERGVGVTLFAIDVTVEGFVSAIDAAAVGPALSQLIAVARKYALAAENAVAEIDQVLDGDCDSTLVDEEGVGPHAFFALALEVRYGTSATDPFIQA